MSVTISATPFLLFSAISATGSFIQSLARLATKKDVEHFELTSADIEELFQKEVETTFVDKSALLKTLTEHGAVILNESEGEITCELEQFTLNFYKKNNSKETPFSLMVTCENCNGIEEVMEDINSEYAENAQEISYNLIKQRLEDRNLSIDNEEIYEDNTIVLTVNLE